MALFFFQSTAKANVGEAFGFGSRASALGGATGSWGADGFAAYYNPASVGLQTDKRFALSVGLTYNQPHFKAINGVVVDNDFVSDKTGPVLGDVSVDDYRPTFGTVLGATLRLFPQYWNLSAGVTGFLPLKQLAYMDTGQAYVPDYVLYRARTQRPQLNAAVSAEPFEGFSVGGGLQLAFSLTSTADVFVQTEGTKPSSLKFAATLKPKLIPYFGLLYVSKKNDRKSVVTSQSERGAYTAGFVTRLEGTSENDMTLNTNARVLTPCPAFPCRFGASSVLYYDPMSFELSASYQYLKQARIFAQVDYQLWSKFAVPANAVTPASGVTMNKGEPPSIYPVDIIIPRVGHEYEISRFTIRTGYSYRPSIFKDAPNGPGNYLDPARDIFTAGLGVRFEKLLDFATPWTLDFHATYHSMRSQTIKKPGGNEQGTGTGARMIGAPGYDADGHVWGAGASMTVAL